MKSARAVKSPETAATIRVQPLNWVKSVSFPDMR
jgi:hypothetical protein